MAPSLIETISEPSVVQAEFKSAVAKASSCCSVDTSVEQNGVDMYQARNPSLQVTADHRIKMVDAPMNRPGRGEVLLHIKATGICG